MFQNFNLMPKKVNKNKGAEKVAARELHKKIEIIYISGSKEKQF